MPSLPCSSWERLTPRQTSSRAAPSRRVAGICPAVASEAGTKASTATKKHHHHHHHHHELPTVLPPSLRNNVAILEAPNAETGKTMCYVLGMSHVSKASCDQIRELIHLVRPDVVAVELCRERLGLLVDAEAPLDPIPLWHTRKIMLGGLPTEDVWPTEEQVQALLKSQAGRPLSTRDIEEDVIALLSTGLFSTVRPFCEVPGPNEAPSFTPNVPAGGGPLALSMVKPLASIRFGLQPRLLPPITQLTVRLDSSLRGAGVSQEDLARIGEAAVAASQAAAAAALEQEKTAEAQAEKDKGNKKPEDIEKETRERVRARELGVSGLPHYLKARAELKAVFAPLVDAGVQVVFEGVEYGRTEAVVRVARPSDPPLLTGLESSAIDGEGEGIVPFRPNRPMFKVSDKTFIPTDIVERLRAQQREMREREAAAAAGDGSSGSDSAAEASVSEDEEEDTQTVTCRSEFRPWSIEEVEKASPPTVPKQPLADALAQYMMTAYSKYQAVAARRVGIAPGAAWRAAFEAATEVGTQQLLLADRPSSVTERKFADAVFGDAGARFLGALGLLVGACVEASVTYDGLPVGLFGLGAALAAGTALMWPLVGPFLEVSKFSSMSAVDIENMVTMKEPIQSGDLTQPVKVYGEDSLLDLPGAMQHIIRERDTYMAKTLAAAAKGGVSPAPAFVLAPNATATLANRNGLVWRYMAPEGEGVPPLAAPAGCGDGAFQPLKNVRSIVAVVGTAHVRGMCAEWQKAVEDGNVQALLE